MKLKKQVLVAALLLLVIISVILTFKFKSTQRKKEESLWFVNNLNYNFCGKILDIEVLSHQWGYGYVVCKLTSHSTIFSNVEDSLRKKLRYHENLEFIVSQENETVKFLIQGAELLQGLDSVCVDSENDRIVVYKNGSVNSTQHMSLCLKTEKFR